MAGPSTVTTVDFSMDNSMPFYCGFELELQGPTIQFASAASSGLKSVSPAVLEVVLTNGEAGQTYTVDYAVTGGSFGGWAFFFRTKSGVWDVVWSNEAIRNIARLCYDGSE